MNDIKDYLKAIVSTQEKMLDRQDEMNSTLIRQSISLEHHIKRTDLLEENINKNQVECHEDAKEILQIVQPLRNEYNAKKMIAHRIKFWVPIIASLVGVLGTLGWINYK